MSTPSGPAPPPDLATPTSQPPEAPTPERPPRRRGFAAMSEERRRALAQNGGRTTADRGTGHRWTPEEARAAGRTGGRKSKRRPKE